MEFCQKCGSVLVEKRKNFACSRCGHASKSKVKLKTTEKIENKSEVAVLKKEDTEVLPLVTANCKKCGNDKALFWTVQTRAGDEAETKFFKCNKCSFTWREYR